MTDADCIAKVDQLIERRPDVRSLVNLWIEKGRPWYKIYFCLRPALEREGIELLDD